VVKGLQRKHWLVHVLRRAGSPAAEEPDIDPGAPAGAAWETVCGSTGLAPDDLAKLVAGYFRLSVAALEEAEATALRLVPGTVARKYSVFPLREDEHEITVATSDPTHFVAEQTLGFVSGRRVVFEVAPPPVIAERISARYGAEGARESAAGGEPREEAILVVDDDPEDRLLVRTILQKHGFHVEEARDGGQALELVGGGGGHALVVLDLEMPEVDGREALRRLRSSAPTVGLPVVMLTGSPDRADEHALMEAGADDYLRKPLDPSRFLARVNATLRRARMV
jgi:CheY-like chemotaxis protein